MLFGQTPVTRPERARGAVLSAAVHLALGLIAVAVARYQPAEVVNAVDSLRPPAQMIWVPSDAPATGGGGGGGGNQTPTPPRPAQAVGRDALTMQVAPPPDVSATLTPPADSPPLLEISAASLQAGVSLMAGAVDAQPATSSSSRASGDGDTSGTTRGRGDGRGDGPGLGPGRDGESGDGYAIGNGVSSPRLLRDEKPQYTAEAMRARIAGTVGLSCVVDRDGSVRSCRLTRSLDPRYGLDLEAIRAAQRWQFAPGRRGAEPVPVRVTIEMAFSLR